MIVVVVQKRGDEFWGALLLFPVIIVNYYATSTLCNKDQTEKKYEKIKLNDNKKETTENLT